MPQEFQRLGETSKYWFDTICNHQSARVSNGPTEALNNLIKRTKGIGFGCRNLNDHRNRVLLYAHKPIWRVAGSFGVPGHE